jgi:hypothetical protein
MDYLAIVKERAEGKDLSVLGGSVKFVADDTIVFIDGVNGEISSLTRKCHHLLCLKQAPLLNRPEQARMPPFRQTQKPFWRIR